MRSRAIVFVSAVLLVAPLSFIKRTPPPAKVRHVTRPDAPLDYLTHER